MKNSFSIFFIFIIIILLIECGVSKKDAIYKSPLGDSKSDVQATMPDSILAESAASAAGDSPEKESPRVELTNAETIESSEHIIKKDVVIKTLKPTHGSSNANSDNSSSSGISYGSSGSTSNSNSDALNIVDVTNENAINSKLAKNGRMIYFIPEKMKYRHEYHAFLRITKHKNSYTVLDNLHGTVYSAYIPSTQTMEVKLIDPSPADDKNFDITYENDGVQFVDSEDTYTEWNWNVTPITVGASKLQIVVSVIKDGNRKENVYQKDITIQSDFFLEVKYFLLKYWQHIFGTLFTTVVVPLVIFFYKKRKKKKQVKAAEVTNPTPPNP